MCSSLKIQIKSVEIESVFEWVFFVALVTGFCPKSVVQRASVGAFFLNGHGKSDETTKTEASWSEQAWNDNNPFLLKDHNYKRAEYS